MKYHVQFMELNSDGLVCDGLESDSIFILDGRNTIDTMKSDAYTRYKQLKYVQPNYIGFIIYKGNLEYRKAIVEKVF